ncbi:MAG: hypothetical protein JWQ58_199 [Reyranella sp.]|nr:hypothetical protein [Reyranella sp.]
MAADEPASPACLAHEADDAYMGFATPADIDRFRKGLDTASDVLKAEMLREMLPKIRNDGLHAEFSALLAEISFTESKT